MLFYFFQSANSVSLNNLRISQIQNNSANLLDKVSTEISPIWESFSCILRMFWEYSGLKKSALWSFPSKHVAFLSDLPVQHRPRQDPPSPSKIRAACHKGKVEFKFFSSPEYWFTNFTAELEEFFASFVGSTKGSFNNHYWKQSQLFDFFLLEFPTRSFSKLFREKGVVTRTVGVVLIFLLKNENPRSKSTSSYSPLKYNYLSYS